MCNSQLTHCCLSWSTLQHHLLILFWALVSSWLLSFTGPFHFGHMAGSVPLLQVWVIMELFLKTLGYWMIHLVSLAGWRQTTGILWLVFCSCNLLTLPLLVEEGSLAMPGTKPGRVPPDPTLYWGQWQFMNCQTSSRAHGLFTTSSCWFNWMCWYTVRICEHHVDTKTNDLHTMTQH